MPYERINVQLAVKLGADGKLPSEFYEKPTTAQLNAIKNMTWLEIIRAMIKKFKQYSEKINSGAREEENTIIAKRHICQHDVQPHTPCVEEDI